MTTHENHAAQQGGALRNDGAAAIAQIDTSTLSFDTADFGAEVYLEEGTVVLYSSILRHTSSNACAGDPVDSEGYNLVNDQTCDLSATGDMEGIDPLLAPLANYGGPTQTHALEPGSPALNAGDPACPPPSSDQRGTSRPQGGRCDVGAVEMSGVLTFTATPAPGSETATPVPGTPTPTATPAGTTRKFGDVNCDGIVDELDALAILLEEAEFDADQDEPCPEIDSNVSIQEQ